MPASPTVASPRVMRAVASPAPRFCGRNALGSLLAALLSLAFLAACSGGGGSALSPAAADCGVDQPGVLCLSSCNLGCSDTGCSRTEIAQNEFVVLTFSEDLDPNSVNSSSILFRTASGEEAVGEYLVTANRVEFVPSLVVSGGQTFYGFTSGETYRMTIRGGDDSANVVRGTSGRAFGETLTCTLESRRGIIDYDEQPPVASLASPRAGRGVPRDSNIVIEFSELIDVTPFLNSAQSPVRIFARRAFAGADGQLVCQESSDRQPLAGSQFPTFDVARGVTVVAFQPASALPGNACIEIEISSAVADLSGRAGLPQDFSFYTEQVALDPGSIVEEFVLADGFDREQSAATWQDGELRFASIGGDGRHGRFDLDALDPPTAQAGVLTYTVDCDQTIIPAANTTTGAPITITDGRFLFSEFVVPANVRLRFVGSAPPVITACGRIEIRGEIDLSGASLDVVPTPVAGGGPPQQGAAGGIFAGSGGVGGAQCLGDGAGNGSFSGGDGDDARLLAGHGYAATRFGSGGRGSALHPATGLSEDRLFSPAVASVHACLSLPAGGGGGSSALAGAIGRAVSNNVADPVTGSIPWLEGFGPATVPAGTVTLLPYPPLSGALPSSQHFLVGGGGGGGGASNAALTLDAQTSPVWAPGGAGAGGGGCMALRAGRSLRLSGEGLVRVSGGSTQDVTGLGAVARAMPGGGGAGGSLVLQCAATVALLGRLDLRGGRGGVYDRTWLSPPQGASLRSEAGAGAAGAVRLEARDADPSVLQAVVLDGQGFLSVDDVVERDPLVACQSLFYSTDLTLGPQWSRYVIEAVVDGQPMVFSDDPAVSPMQATSGAPIRALFQAATIELVTGVAGDIKPWRTLVRADASLETIASDARNGVRFRLVVDRNLAQEVVVTKVMLDYQQ